MAATDPSLLASESVDSDEDGDEDRDGIAEPGKKIQNSKDKSSTEIQSMGNEKLCKSIFPLLVSLHEQNALPALIFNYERTTCELLATMTLTALEKAEDQQHPSPQNGF